MSVTVHSVVVNSDVLVPMADQIKGEERVPLFKQILLLTDIIETEMEMLTPWVFEHFDVADSDCTHIWPRERGDFRDFFWYLNSYYSELNESNEKEKDIASAMNESETITLPRRNWTVPRRADFTNLMGSQGTMLRILMETIYNLESGKEGGYQLQ